MKFYNFKITKTNVEIKFHQSQKDLTEKHKQDNTKSTESCHTNCGSVTRGIEKMQFCTFSTCHKFGKPVCSENTTQ